MAWRVERAFGPAEVPRKALLISGRLTWRVERAFGPAVVPRKALLISGRPAWRLPGPVAGRLGHGAVADFQHALRGGPCQVAEWRMTEPWC